MNNEKDILGDSTLPPMGTVTDDNNKSRVDLPPISNFTNFGDNFNNTIDSSLKQSNVDSVDLMNQFNTNNNTNNVQSGYQSNSVPLFGINNQNSQNNVVSEQQVIPSTTSSVLGINNQNSQNNVVSEQVIPSTTSSVFDINNQNSQNNVVSEQVIPSTTTPLFDINNQFLQNGLGNDIANNSLNMNNQSGIGLGQNDTAIKMPDGLVNNKIITNDSLNNVDNELISNFNINDNSNQQSKIDTNLDSNSIVDIPKKEKAKKKKKKHKKILFILLLVLSVLLIVSVLLICYFKFWKSDKLVCSLQDYSNEQFLLEESMTMHFKGSNLINANFKRNLTFVESYMSSKDSYLEELRNQFEGLGFDVSYSENDTGFEVNMNFTKSELESWYGTELKNSSKESMKKEMKDVGYTCK